MIYGDAHLSVMPMQKITTLYGVFTILSPLRTSPTDIEKKKVAIRIHFHIQLPSWDVNHHDYN